MIVDMTPSAEQRMIEDSLVGFLGEYLPIERLRDHASHGGRAEARAWAGLCGLSLFGLGLCEDQGGLGFGMAEEALVARTLGSFLVSPSVVAQVIAPHFADDPGLRAGIMAGEHRVAMAALHGFALDADGASHVLLVSHKGAGLIELQDASLGEIVAGLDETLALQACRSESSSSFVGLRVSLMLAAYLTGIAQTASRMAVNYAMQREQFGQEIGAFQAIKHICADMRVRADAAECQVLYAAIAGDRADSPAGEAAAARMLANEAAIENAKANIQIHGGMGFTAECDAHLLLKRAQVLARFGADAAELRKLVLSA